MTDPENRRHCLAQYDGAEIVYVSLISSRETSFETDWTTTDPNDGTNDGPARRWPSPTRRRCRSVSPAAPSPPRSRSSPLPPRAAFRRPRTPTPPPRPTAPPYAIHPVQNVRVVVGGRALGFFIFSGRLFSRVAAVVQRRTTLYRHRSPSRPRSCESRTPYRFGFVLFTIVRVGTYLISYTFIIITVIILWFFDDS